MSDIEKLVAALSPKKRARLAELLGLAPAASTQEPIAIVGMSCRFPGAAGVDGYWQVLSNGIDAISEVPADRWDAKEFYDPDPVASGKTVTRYGGFLERVDLFDAGFFGISPREAQHMDPQQRLLLEVAWEALEDAGQTLERLAGSRTGVFVGCGRFDYGLGTFPHYDQLEGYDNTGNMLHAIAGRLAYLLNLRGPTMSVDTACSSSLVAIHLACQSLRQGDAEMAVAGGVSLMLKPSLSIAISKAGALSPDGRCKTFDADADGYARGEGCGVIVLKRLADALAEKDPIYAVIRGTAVGHSGRSSGFTVPNVRAQRDVFTRALANAGLRASQVGYIEAHGTATALGDPIEMEAVLSVYGQDRPKDRPCVIGSAKTNFGHLEPAAGVAGLMKAALTLHHELIPPHLNFKRLNPNIPPSEALVIPTRAMPWPRSEQPRAAAVSSFGISGVNAHAVLAEAPAGAAAGSSRPAPSQDEALLLPLSARGAAALKDMARRYRDYLGAAGAAVPLQDVVYTAANRRTHHDQRLAVAFSSRAELVERLEAYLSGESRPGLCAGERSTAAPVKLAFVFCGQGPQWWAMGRQLLAGDAVFRGVVERCDAELKKLASWSLLAELQADEARSRLGETEIAQPALFALQAGLAAVWASWGVKPEAIVGHSVGEIAAAYVGGALTLPDAVRVAYHRGRIMQRAVGQGRMAALGLSLDETRSALTAFAGRVEIAAVNSPSSTTIAGDAAAVEEVCARVAARGAFARLLRGEFAFHSRHMDPFVDELVKALADVPSQPSAVALYSTVTGQLHGGRRPGDYGGEYWSRNMREPVLFAAAVERMAEQGVNAFLELGPHPVLSADVSQTLRQAGRSAAVLPSLQREKPERQTMLGSLGQLFVLGHPIEWSAAAPQGECARLPSYAWQRERYWLAIQKPATPKDAVAGAVAAPAAAAAPAPSQPAAGAAAKTAGGVQRTVVAAVAGLLGYPEARVGAGDSLVKLGIDSLMAFRLKAQLDAELGVSVPVAELLKNVTIGVLVSTLEALRGGPSSGDANGAVNGSGAGKASGSGDRVERVRQYLVTVVAATLGYPPQRIDPKASLTKLGLDSLLAFQLKARIDADLGCSVPVAELMKNAPLAALAERLAAEAARA